ncbi:MAG: hypothetical protein PWQ09_1156 [Candidatus Cloacimonadota bacterium]|jgi:hypothetical protein|nr:hypothetical protein [Candidatus Cloacimonadota bacterium]
MSVLFLTIGNRDVQYVYDYNGQKVRMRIFSGKDNLNNLQYIKLKDVSEEVDRRDINDIKSKIPIGITFPIIEKAINYTERRNEKIESIILLCTNRQKLATKLEELVNFSLSKDWLEAATLADNLYFHAKRDNTSLYSDIIERELSKAFHLHSIKIGNNHPVLKKMMKIDPQNYKTEKDLLADLVYADFNTYKLTYPEIQSSLVPLYETLQNKTIYLSLAGGMPLVQRVLEHLIRSIYYHQTIHTISIPEKDTTINLKQPQAMLTLNDNFEYLNLIEKRNLIVRLLLRLNFSFAEKQFLEIEEFFIQNDKIDLIDDIFKKISEEQNSHKLDTIFISLYSNVLSAIYEENYSYLAILLKIIQEKTLKRIIKLQHLRDNKLVYKEKNKKNYLYSDKIAYDSQEYEPMDFFFKNYNYIQQNPLLKQYHELYLHESYTTWSDDFATIKKVRDQVIHKALTIIEDKEKSSFIKFLRLDPEKLNSVKTSVKVWNITAEVLDFENNFMGENSTFFKLKDLWFKDDGIKFDLRKRANEIIDLLLQLELK